MADSETTLGIVIRCFPYSESDLVLHAITEGLGKISIMAKGARRSKRRFGDCPDLFDRGHFLVKRGRGSMQTLVQFRAEAPFKRIREGLLGVALASCICEGIDFLIKEESGDAAPVYRLLDDSLRRVDLARSEAEGFEICSQFLVSLLNLCGFAAPESSSNLDPIAGLHALFDRIEELSDRQLKSRAALIGLLSR